MAELKDYTSLDINEYLVSDDSVLTEYAQTDALAFDQAFEGVPGGNIIFGGMQIRKKKYADSTTAGVWIGVDTDGIGKINIGDSTNFLLWNGSSLVVSGDLTATSGTIGGWTITSTSLTGESAGIIETSATGYRLKMSGADGAYQFLNNDTLLVELVSAIVPNSGTGGALLRHSTDNAWVGVTGSAGDGWASLSGSGGDFAVISDTSDSWIATSLRLLAHWLPETTDTYDLGSSTYKWESAYLNGALYIYEASGTDGIAIIAPSLSASWTLTLPTTDGTSGQFLQTNGSGVTTWAASTAGANTALSNLSGVAINTSLISDTDSTDDLGSSSKAWANLYADNVRISSGGELYYNGVIAFDFSTTAGEIYVGSSSLANGFEPYQSLAMDLGASDARWAKTWTDDIDVTGDITNVDTVHVNAGIDMNNNDIYDLDEVKWRTGNASSPSSDGAMSFYDSGTIQYRGRIASTNYSFDLTAA